MGQMDGKDHFILTSFTICNIPREIYFEVEVLHREKEQLLCLNSELEDAKESERKEFIIILSKPSQPANSTKEGFTSMSSLHFISFSHATIAILSHPFTKKPLIISSLLPPTIDNAIFTRTKISNYISLKLQFGSSNNLFNL